MRSWRPQLDEIETAGAPNWACAKKLNAEMARCAAKQSRAMSANMCS